MFDWPGTGLYAVTSAIAGDFKPVMGVTLIVGLNFMIANLIVDLLYGVLDPRLRSA
ncbi:Nickel transport system permease protein NikB [compost metagenome]